jgi:hypothetical protein
LDKQCVGLIHCLKKDDELVEYVLNRCTSLMLIAEYQTCLPDKEILQNKLRELREMAEVEGLTDDEREGDEE